AEIYTDGDHTIPTRTKVRVERLRVNRSMELQFRLRNSGGAAMRLVPATEADRSVKRYKKQIL
ncbi:MAG: hypothetical protein IKM37_04610, partial [Alistipes sp.]|nr:hypothetical protein [Alistipes sp.]